MVRIFTVWSGQHSNRVAAEIFVEASRSAPPHGLVRSHRVVFAVEVGVELGLLMRVARSGGVVLAMIEGRCANLGNRWSE